MGTFLKVWKTLIDTLVKLLLLFTFIGIIVFTVNLVRYFYLNEPLKVVMSSLILYTLIHVNLKTQGGS